MSSLYAPWVPFFSLRTRSVGGVGCCCCCQTSYFCSLFPVQWTTSGIGLRVTKRMLESTATFGVEAAGQVYNQTNEFVYLGGNVNHNNGDLSIEVNRRKRMVQLPEVHPRTVRPRDNTVRLHHVEPARVPLRHATPSPPQLPDSLHRLAKEQSRRPPDFLYGHAYQDGK